MFYFTWYPWGLAQGSKQSKRLIEWGLCHEVTTAKAPGVCKLIKGKACFIIIEALSSPTLALTWHGSFHK